MKIIFNYFTIAVIRSIKLNILPLINHFYTLTYRCIVLPLQGKKIFNFIESNYKIGNKVLDFGCGLGNLTNRFKNADYTGVDIVRSRITHCKRLRKGYKFVVIDVIAKTLDRLPFNNNSFDIIVLSLCLHHISTENCKLILQEFYRILKKDGIILGIEPYNSGEHKISNIWMNLVDKGDFILTKQCYSKLLNSEGFDVESLGLCNKVGYRLWQYKGSKSKYIERQPIHYSKTAYRLILKPIQIFLEIGIIYLLLLLILFVLFTLY